MATSRLPMTRRKKAWLVSAAIVGMLLGLASAGFSGILIEEHELREGYSWLARSWAALAFEANLTTEQLAALRATYQSAWNAQQSALQEAGKQEDEAKQTEILTNALNTTRAQVQAKLKTVLTDEQMALHAKALGGVAGTTFKPAEFKPGAGFAPRRGLRVRPNASGVVRRAPKLQVRRTNQTGVEGIIGEDGAAALLTPRAELETTAMAGLSETDGRRLSRAIAFLKAGQQDAGMAAWRSFIGAAQSDGPIDIAALIQHVLRESYVETSEDLKFHAEKVQQFDEQKQAIREYLTELREIQAKFEAWARGNGLAPDDAEFTPLTVSEPVLPTGTEARGVVIFLNRRITSLAELTALIEEWDEHLQTLGDDAQLANIDLQSMLQKQQHTMRLLSQISKALHDAAMAIERKIR